MNIEDVEIGMMVQDRVMNEWGYGEVKDVSPNVVEVKFSTGRWMIYKNSQTDYLTQVLGV